MPCVVLCVLPLVHLKWAETHVELASLICTRVRLFIHTSPNQPDFHSNQARVRLKQTHQGGVKAAIVTGVGGLRSKVRSKRLCCLCWSPSNSMMNGTLTDKDLKPFCFVEWKEITILSHLLHHPWGLNCKSMGRCRQTFDIMIPAQPAAISPLKSSNFSKASDPTGKHGLRGEQWHFVLSEQINIGLGLMEARGPDAVCDSRNQVPKGPKACCCFPSAVSKREGIYLTDLR